MPMRVLRCCLFVAVYVLVAPGCTNQASSQATNDLANSAPTRSANNHGVQPELHPPADKSLTLEQLIEAGVPAHDREWSGDDMTRAANILAAIAQKNTDHLPRYLSQHSGQAFERLTANDNLNLYRNRVQRQIRCAA